MADAPAVGSGAPHTVLMAVGCELRFGRLEKKNNKRNKRKSVTLAIHPGDVEQLVKFAEVIHLLNTEQISVADLAVVLLMIRKLELSSILLLAAKYISLIIFKFVFSISYAMDTMQTNCNDMRTPICSRCASAIAR